MTSENESKSSPDVFPAETSDRPLRVTAAADDEEKIFNNSLTAERVC